MHVKATTFNTDSKVLWERLESCGNRKIKMASHVLVLKVHRTRRNWSQGKEKKSSPNKQLVLIFYFKFIQWNPFNTTTFGQWKIGRINEVGSHYDAARLKHVLHMNTFKSIINQPS